MAMSKIPILKFLELVLTCTCIGLHYHSFQTADNHSAMVTSGTFGGYLVILIAVFAGILSGQPINKRIDIFFSLMGCALFVTTGALAIQYFDSWHFSKDTKDIGLAKGSMSIINGAIFLIDAGLTFRAD